MWLISFDTDYYPYIEIYKSYDEAKERYDELCELLGTEDCVFISEVIEYKEGKDYEIEYGE